MKRVLEALALFIGVSFLVLSMVSILTGDLLNDNRGSRSGSNTHTGYGETRAADATARGGPVTTVDEPPTCPDCGTPLRLKHTLESGIIWVRDCACKMNEPEAFIATSVTLGQGAIIGGQGSELMAAMRFQGGWNRRQALEELTVVTSHQGLRILGIGIADFLLGLDQ